jgi:hypothetical protein
LQSIEGQLSEIKALLVRMNADAGGAQVGAGGAPKPPRTKRPPAPPQQPSSPPGGEKT